MNNKTERFIKSIALSSLSYFRMVLVVCSLIAWGEREWFGLMLALVCFGATTTFLNKVIDMPTDEAINNLSKLVEQMSKEEE